MLFLWLVLSILCEGSALRGDHEKERHWRFKSGELTDLEFRVGGSYDYLHRSPTPSKHPRVSDDAEFAHYKPPTPGNVYKNTGFVKTNGTRLMLHGKKWEFAGTNAFYGALEYIMSDEELRYMLREQERAGTSVIRVFMSSHERVPNSMMPTFGEYSETALRRLDLLLLEAAKRNIRVIITLSNYWKFLGGMQKWVDAAYGGGLPMELFYTDEFLRNAYKQFASTIIQRRNTLTGLSYTEDPTIFAYELANEPRTSHGYDALIGRRPGATICDWVAEMSAFVRSLDSNHLVTVGDEGMRADVPTRPGDERAWLNDGHEGADFICNLQYADVATTHIYPDSWGFGPTEYQWLGPNYLKDRRDIAWAQNKPIILEEYGMRRGYLQGRDEYFTWVHDQINSLGYSGSLVWAVSHEPREDYEYAYYGYNDGQGYVFGLSGTDTDGVNSVLAQNARVKSRIKPERPCKDVPPDESYSCKQQSEWGKCVETGGFMQLGTCDWSCGRCGQQVRDATETVSSGQSSEQASAQLSELIPAEDEEVGKGVPPPGDGAIGFGGLASLVVASVAYS